MTTPNKTRIKTNTTVYTILLSVCLFLGIVCACLLVALVLVGRNLATSSCWTRNCTNNRNQTIVNSSDLNASQSDEPPDLDSREISVRIQLRNNDSVAASSADWRSGWRLPRDVHPLHYNLTLWPHLITGHFNGTVNITIKLTEQRDHIIIHGHNLNISIVRVISAEGMAPLDIIDLHDDPLHQLWVVDFENSLAPGIYYMLFEFAGATVGKRVGFYSSTYLDEFAQRRYIATSKLEPTYARQVFPCFDEPNFKAKYSVQIVKPKNSGYIALSNMDQIGDPIPQSDGNEIIKFNTSVPMSTYVTCFIVCDFDYTESNVIVSHGDPVKLRVYATPQQKNKTKYALEMAEKVTQYYVNYFGIEYPLPKLDMIAIPDFVSGAMEHWGLVTYRETALLYDENAASASNKQRVATVVAHELAHMWFGNLVTMDWWNDLWLNEGFATYMQFKSINEITPDWDMADQFLIDQLHSVLKFDATKASHPIVQTVATPDQITEIFDSISYNKGASVLRMLENAVGEKGFQQAITAYLTKHKYNNAVTQDLLEELQHVVNTYETPFDVTAFVNTWTTQTGYPVVKIIQTNPGEFVLTQQRFWTDAETKDATKNTWIIPITYISSTNGYNNSKLVWFGRDEKELKISVPNATWIKVNYREVGYYRVNYEIDLWNALIPVIEKMSVADRAHLLEDSFSLARAGQLEYQVPLNFTKQLINEIEYIPWSVAASKLKGIKTLLNADVVYRKLKKHMDNILSKILNSVSWEQDSKKHLDKLLRAKILDLACDFGQESCLNNAAKLFEDWLVNNKALPLDVKALVYEYGMVNINENNWEKVFDKYKNEIDAQEKLKLLKGLASSNNKNLIIRLVESAWDESIVRSQDYFTCLQYISENPIGTEYVWNHVRNNWEKLVDRYTLNDRYLGRLIPAITSSFTMEIQLNDMKEFFNKYPDAGAGANSRKEALENVANNIKWLQKYKADVENWLNENV